MITAFIFARAGSKGVPGKNSKLLGGKPLVKHAIECVATTKHVNQIVVSTDCQDVAAIAYDMGVKVLLRPEELCRDDSPEWWSWRHAIDNVATDMFVSVPTTCPLRSPDDIDAVIEALGQEGWKHGEPGAAVTITPAQHNPFYQAMRRNAAKIIYPAIPQPVGQGKRITRRQDAPEVFNIVGVAYAAWPQYIKNHSSLFGGKLTSVVVPNERALDIDTPFDFEVAESLHMCRIARASAERMMKNRDAHEIKQQVQNDNAA